MAETSTEPSGMMPSKLGRYEILIELGRGAMGVVYKAADPVLDRTVAIKTIGMSLDPGERAEYEGRFFQEAKAAGGLAHPNIVTVYDIGKSGNTAYMAMEFLEGKELGSLYGGGRSAPVDKAMDTAAQIAEGLGFAHERDVIHRDIKPANIMILKNGLVKITDFGIARMRSSEVKTQTGMLLGSPRYMSPEVFLGKRADGRSDIFSLGIILYEMLTGAAPFSGDSISALMYQTINFVPPAPSAVSHAIPQMLDFIVAKTLAKNPEERYQSAGELARDLRECARRLGAGQSASMPATRPPASVAPGEVPVLADSGSRTRLLEKTVPLTRASDALDEAAAPSALTLGLSRDFDSLKATQRLAARTGMERELGGAADNDGAGAPEPAGVASVSGPYRIVSAPAGFGAAWTRREIAIFAAGIGFALIAATAIVVM